MSRTSVLLGLLGFAAAASAADGTPPTPATDGGVPVPAPADPPADPPAEPQLPGFGDVIAPPPISDDELDDETIVVISDPFARWEGTRWYIKTEVALPFGITFYEAKADEDSADPLRVSAFQIRTILACDKDFEQGKKHYQVHCTVEDFGLQAVPVWDRFSGMSEDEWRKMQDKRIAAGKPALPASLTDVIDRLGPVLQHVDDVVTGAAVQMQVDDMGRITDFDIEGVAKDRDYEAATFDTLRMLMSRVAVGFDMKLQKWHTLEQGFWTENTSKLMSMPVPGGGTSMGTSLLIHRLTKMDGHLVVESRGKGVIAYVDPYSEERDLTWQTSLAGVSVYDEDDGFMTERVWVLKGVPNASSWLDLPYWHAGRIVQLGGEQKPSVGDTRVVSLPGHASESGNLPEWKPIEQ